MYSRLCLCVTICCVFHLAKFSEISMSLLQPPSPLRQGVVGGWDLKGVNTKYVYEAVFCRFASICFLFHVSRVKSELHPANSTWIRPEPDSWKERQISNQFYFIIMHTMLKEENNNCCFNIINTFTNQTNTTFQFNFKQVIQYRYRYRY